MEYRTQLSNVTWKVTKQVDPKGRMKMSATAKIGNIIKVCVSRPNENEQQFLLRLERERVC